MKNEDSPVSCAYGKFHRADECLAGILPQPGVHSKRASWARQYCEPWTHAPTVSLQDLRENVKCEGGPDVCRTAQADGADRDGGDAAGVCLSSASHCASL